MKDRKKATAAAVGMAILMLAVWIAYNDEDLGLATYQVEVSGLPAAFDGKRIVQLSDLHNAMLCGNNEKLYEIVNGAMPDMIFITGDMLDSCRTDVDAAIAVAAKMTTAFSHSG